MNYCTALTSINGYYLLAKIRPNYHHHHHHHQTRSPTISRQRKRSTFVGRSLNRDIGLKVITHVWRYRVWPDRFWLFVSCRFWLKCSRALWPRGHRDRPRENIGGLNFQLKFMLKEVWNNLMFPLPSKKSVGRLTLNLLAPTTVGARINP